LGWFDAIWHKEQNLIIKKILKHVTAPENPIQVGKTPNPHRCENFCRHEGGEGVDFLYSKIFDIRFSEFI
jgi:hypothetical protein